MAEARNLRNLTAQQTPLLGEENTPLHELQGRTGFEGATPRGSVSATPNPLATPFRSSSSSASDVSATPGAASSIGVGATPLRTPMRDNLSINNDENNGSGFATPRDQLMDVKRQLRQGFSSLPQPKNEFELVLPEDQDHEEGEQGEEVSEEVAKAMKIEDRTDRENRLKELRELEEKKEFERRSQSVKRGLPRPLEVDATKLLAQLDLESNQEKEVSSQDDEQVSRKREVEKMVTMEMIRLLQHDSILYPVGGSKTPGGSSSSSSTNLVRYKDEELTSARKLVHDELAQLVGLPGASEQVLKRTICLQVEEFDQLWKPSYESLAYSVKLDRYVDKTSLSDQERIEGLRSLIESNRDKMASESSKASKIEKKLGLTLGGYIARSKNLSSKLNEGYEELNRSRIELESFARLATNEQGALLRRTESLKDEVDRLERKEREGQYRFKELLDLKERLERETEEMELQEAELLNEKALAQMEE